MNKLRIVIPKGRIFENVVKLLNEAGIYMQVNERGYRPIVNNPEIEIKIMKPQNIPKLVELGSHDDLLDGGGLYSRLCKLQSELSKVRGV